jgi:alcohol dehydrogenase (cytochrome c)
MSRVPRLAVITLVFAWLCAMVASAANPQTQDAGWPSNGYDLTNTHHVNAPQINSKTIPSLGLAWTFRTGSYGKFETTPIVVGNTMYVTTGIDNSVFALDAATGAERWRYSPHLKPAKVLYAVNRGVAYDRGLVFFATLDGRLIALDSRNGNMRWEVQVVDPAQGYSETMAPLAWNGLVYVGSAGGEYGIRGCLSAYSQTDGKLRWRWWSVGPHWEGSFVEAVLGFSMHRDVARERADAPHYRDAWKHGGGPIWMTPALDATRSTLFASVGNPSPTLVGNARPGDNLFTDSLVALDATTGKLKWYFQAVPHDLWDYDLASSPLLFDSAIVGVAGKTGWFYFLNRDTGRVVRVSQAFVPQQNVFVPPSKRGVTIAPTGGGGAIAPVAFDPSLRLVFVSATATSYIADTSMEWPYAAEPYATCSAISADTGKIVWQRRFSGRATSLSAGAPLSAGDLVFIGEEATGKFDALEAKSGNLLWEYQTTAGSDVATSDEHLTFVQVLHDWLAPMKRWLLRQPPLVEAGSHIHATPIAYIVGGREYIAVAGDAYFRNGHSPGNTLYVFALPRKP